MTENIPRPTVLETSALWAACRIGLHGCYIELNKQSYMSAFCNFSSGDLGIPLLKALMKITLKNK
jgi:hypothetical protein